MRGWKILMESDIGATFVGTFVATQVLINEIYGPKIAFSEFMDPSDTNYKLMDLKIHFQSLWTYIFKVYRSKWHKLQVDGLKNTLLEFVDLNNTH